MTAGTVAAPKWGGGGPEAVRTRKPGRVGISTASKLTN